MRELARKPLPRRALSWSITAAQANPVQAPS